MNARRLGLLCSLLAFAAVAQATDFYDYFAPSAGTQPVALTGGDTIATYSVSCSSNTLAAGATQLRPAVAAGPANQTTGRPLRNRCFENTSSATTVKLGSSTVAASDFFTLGESTNAAVVPVYCTHSSGAVYCAPGVGNAAATVVVIEETQSQP